MNEHDPQSASPLACAGAAAAGSLLLSPGDQILSDRRQRAGRRPWPDDHARQLLLSRASTAIRGSTRPPPTALARYGTGTHGVRLLAGHAGSAPRAGRADLPASRAPRPRSPFPAASSPMSRPSRRCVGKNDTVICDKLDHASIVDGCLLSRREVRPVPAQRHGPPRGLPQAIRASRAQAGRRGRRLQHGRGHHRPAGGQPAVPPVRRDADGGRGAFARRARAHRPRHRGAFRPPAGQRRHQDGHAEQDHPEHRRLCRRQRAAVRHPRRIRRAASSIRARFRRPPPLPRRRHST